MATRAAHVELLVEQSYLPALLDVIGRATKSVDLIQYNFFSESGDVALVAGEIENLKEQHPDLPVRAFLEGDHGDGAARNLATARKLEAAHVNVTLDSKNLVTHAKGVCIDDQEILAGSHNLTNTSVGKNNEVSLRIKSRVLGNAFRRYTDALVSAPDKLVPLVTRHGQIAMVTDSAYYQQLIDLIQHATRSLDISMYAFPALGLGGKPNPMAAEVLSALKVAAGRGCKIRIYLEQSDTFRRDITDANRAVADALRDQPNVEVRFDPPDKITHSKFIIRDRQEVLLGSTNWTDGDFSSRHQLNWRVAMSAVAEQLSLWFERKFDGESAPPIA